MLQKGGSLQNPGPPPFSVVSNSGYPLVCHYLTTYFFSFLSPIQTTSLLSRSDNSNEV